MSGSRKRELDDDDNCPKKSKVDRDEDPPSSEEKEDDPSSEEEKDPSSEREKDPSGDEDGGDPARQRSIMLCDEWCDALKMLDLGRIRTLLETHGGAIFEYLPFGILTQYLRMDLPLLQIMFHRDPKANQARYGEHWYGIRNVIVQTLELGNVPSDILEFLLDAHGFDLDEDSAIARASDIGWRPQTSFCALSKPSEHRTNDRELTWMLNHIPDEKADLALENIMIMQPSSAALNIFKERFPSFDVYTYKRASGRTFFVDILAALSSTYGIELMVPFRHEIVRFAHASDDFTDILHEICPFPIEQCSNETCRTCGGTVVHVVAKKWNLVNGIASTLNASSPAMTHFAHQWMYDPRVWTRVAKFL